MPIQTACPKCKKAYNLADNFLGKTVKCQACATPFMVRAPGQAVAATASAAGRAPNVPAGSQPAQDLSRFDLDGPIIRKSTDIFSGSAAVSAAAPDPLSNHVIADPGFTDGKTKKRRKKDKAIAAAAPPPSTAPANPHEKTGDHPVFENPFLASAAINRKKNPAPNSKASGNNLQLLLIGKLHKRMLWSLLLGIAIPMFILMVIGLVVLLALSSFDVAAVNFGLSAIWFYVITGLCILSGILSTFFSIVLLVSVYGLAKAIWPSSSKPVVYLISQFVIVWNLISLFSLDRKSRAELRSAGMTVGWMGLNEKV